MGGGRPRFARLDAGPTDATSLDMLVTPEPQKLDDFEDDDARKPVKKCDAAALKVIADWIAQHDGAVGAGAVIDRGFVVVEAEQLH